MGAIKNSLRSVVVAGEVYSENLGDGIIFECIKHLLEKRGIEAVPIDLSGRSADRLIYELGGEERVGSLRRYARVALGRSRQLQRGWSAALWYGRDRSRLSEEWSRKIASADAVILGGGQLLTDLNFNFVPKIHKIGRIARTHQKPLAMFGCGAGAKWGLLAERMFGETLRNAKYLSVRDKASAAILARHASPETVVHVCPDPAFAVGTVFSGRYAASGTPQTLGLGIQPAIHFRRFVPQLKNLSDARYRSFWVALVRGATLSGMRVVLLCNGERGDYSEALAVKRALANQGIDVELKDRPVHPDQLVAQIGSLEALICTRLHAGIVAYGLGRHVIPISWDRKVGDVWDEVGRRAAVRPADVVLSDNPWEYFSETLAAAPLKQHCPSDMTSQVDLALQNCICALGRGS